ncbi:MAG: DUF1992 domain-containing protein [Rubrivivax sp.]
MFTEPPRETDPDQRREQRLRLLEDDIGRKLAEAERNGELRSAKGFGKRLDLQDGYEQTPAELRMGFKLLKDAGVLPPEVQLMREIDALRERIARADAADSGLDAARAQLLAMRQQLAMKLERLRFSGSG